MATIDSEPRPGTAFEKIMEEQATLDEFMAMVDKKLAIDRRHLDDLSELRKTWNPKWSDTGVWKLISPILTYFNDEITHLTVAQDDVLARFSSIPECTSAQDASEGTFEPLGINEVLEKAYMACEGCRQSTVTPEARDSFFEARKAMETLTKNEELEFSPSGTLIPSVDRAYRIAVHRQHQTIAPVVEWYDSKLEGIIERHQQRTEDVKAFFIGFCSSQGKLAVDLSASCSGTLHSTQAFASTPFIAPRHDEMVQGRSHLFLQKLEYHSFFDGRIVKPIFGLGPEHTLRLANHILDKLDELRHAALSLSGSGEIDRAFNIEEWALTNPDLGVAMQQYGRRDLRLLLKVALWSDDPLFPISPVHFNQYANGVPRKKLHQIIELIDPEFQERVMNLLSRLWRTLMSKTYTSNIAVAQLLCHTSGPATIVMDIWRKWDFDGARPLPDGVRRLVIHPWGLIWSKTGAEYVPQ